MQSQLTVRLTDDLDKGVSDLARKLHLRRADVVRMALRKFIEGSEIDREVSPYERVRDLIGSVQSGVTDLGEGHREHLLKKFRKDA